MERFRKKLSMGNRYEVAQGMPVRFTHIPNDNDFVDFWFEKTGFGVSLQFCMKVNMSDSRRDSAQCEIEVRAQ